MKRVLILAGLFFFFVATAHSKGLRVPILCYHAVTPAASGAFALTPKTFELQMRYLHEEGYSVISLNGLITLLKLAQNGEKVVFPPKPVVITFDDSYESIFRHALPILKKFNFPACNFIYTTGLSEGQWKLYQDHEGSLIEIHSHTINHIDLVKRLEGEDDQAWRKRIFTEIAESRRIIGEKLGRFPAYLAYPYGTWNRSVIRMMRIAGYSAGFSAFGGYVRETSSLDVLPRFTIFKRYDFETFRRIVSGEWQGGQGEPDFFEARDYYLELD